MLGRGVELLDHALVRERVHLQPDAGVLALHRRLPCGADPLDQSCAQPERRDEDLPEPRGAPEAGEVVEERGDVLRDRRVGGEEAQVLVRAGGHRVVVAGADVHVPPEHVAFTPDDERHLGVNLQVGEAVDDVHARLLQRTRPLDVPVLVEASLQLHEADALLAVLGALDQRRDERAVAARPVNRGLHRDHVGIAGGGLHERLEAGGERLVRLVDEEVAAADLREQVPRGLGVHEPRWRHPERRLVLELRPVEFGQLVEVREVEGAVDLVDLVGGGAEPLAEPLEHAARRRARDLDPDDVAEAAALQFELDRLEQVVGLVRDLEVSVSRDTKDRSLENLHAGEEPVEEVRDRRLERQHPPALADREEAWQPFGHLHAGEALLARLGVAGEDAEAEREAGDVREGLAGADAERGQDREDLALEAFLELRNLVGIEIVDLRDHDPLVRQRRAKRLLPELCLALGQLEHALTDQRQCGPRGQPVRGAHPKPRRRLAHQSRHPDHEELVQIRRDEPAHLHALEEWEGVVAGEIEEPRVVLQRRQLAIEKATGRLERGSRGHRASMSRLVLLVGNRVVNVSQPSAATTWF